MAGFEYQGLLLFDEIFRAQASLLSWQSVPTTNEMRTYEQK